MYKNISLLCVRYSASTNEHLGLFAHLISLFNEAKFVCYFSRTTSTSLHYDTDQGVFYTSTELIPSQLLYNTPSFLARTLHPLLGVDFTVL